MDEEAISVIKKLTDLFDMTEKEMDWLVNENEQLHERIESYEETINKLMEANGRSEKQLTDIKTRRDMVKERLDDIVKRHEATIRKLVNEILDRDGITPEAFSDSTHESESIPIVIDGYSGKVKHWYYPDEKTFF